LKKSSEADSFFSNWLSPGALSRLTAASDKAQTAEVETESCESPAFVETKKSRSELHQTAEESAGFTSRSSVGQRESQKRVSASRKTIEQRNKAADKDVTKRCNVNDGALGMTDNRSVSKLAAEDCDYRPVNLETYDAPDTDSANSNLCNVGTLDDSSLENSSSPFAEAEPLKSNEVQQKASELITADPLQLNDTRAQHSSILVSDTEQVFQADVEQWGHNIDGWNDPCDSQLRQTPTSDPSVCVEECKSVSDDQIIIADQKNLLVSDDMRHFGVSEEANQLSVGDEDNQPLKEVSSLEGSLETSTDELSEGNKTLIADDSDANRDDTDIDDVRLDSVSNSGIHGDDLNCVEVDQQQIDDVNFKVGEVDDKHDLETQPPKDFDELSNNHQTDSFEKNAGSLSPHSTVSNGSYVKNLLEDAMVDNARDSAGSSDPVRNESGGNSGHTSADEIDTTTSSDIEIISHTSASGVTASGLMFRPFDVSPSRQHMTGSGWISRTGSSAVSGGHHRRSDSGSSAQSLQSRTEDDFASPDGGNGHSVGDHQYRCSREARRHSTKYESGIVGCG
jgi:hypothetical protein